MAGERGETGRAGAAGRAGATGRTGVRPARGQLRAALVAESFALLSESGLAGFSVAELARRLGVSAAAPYRHFRDRDELLAVVATQAAHELTGSLRDAAEAAGGDPVDRLAAAVGAYVRYVGARGAGLDVVYARELRHLRDGELAGAGRELMALLLDLTRDAGHTDPARALAVLEQLFALAHGYTALDTGGLLSHSRLSDEETAERAARAAAALVRGNAM
ncbi:TetR/AcrR family transcriptional regulator [Streptomyces montanisoli]|uniref:TetR/AcrR family transcriptional regulator n=1 Tax=Streptomyces montanisoli TaxID=2798581 RepID=A0A940RTY1_9ACTN|nr:TetR/AcrR family transcriptional regulator [Streptomyces montanisoli]MBP0457372.1 TetR/AcrR family transcriptional regulator [Streptomyces montanisoli]